MVQLAHLRRLLLIGAVALVPHNVFAQTIEMHAVLDGAQDGSASTATGTATATIDTAANSLTYSVQFSGLTSAQSAAHIHGPADPGFNGPVLFNIGVGTPVNGVWFYPQAREADILGGRTYFNIHSQQLPGGEIRGQLTRTPITYCTCAVGPCGNNDAGAGCANSTGAGASIQSSGMASVAIDSLTLTAVGIIQNQNGLFYMGPNQINLPFGDGARCVGGTVFRYPIQNSGTSGVMTLGPGISAFAAANFPATGQVAAGTTWNFQCWYRDPGGPCATNFNLSDAVSATFTP